MPASRVHFALADLREEVKRISGEEEPEIIIKLAPETFEKVIGELSNAVGQPLARPKGESVKFYGLTLMAIPMEAAEEETHG